MPDMQKDMAMKMCKNCNRVNPDDVEVCIECGEDKFTELLMPFYDDIESYLENK